MSGRKTIERMLRDIIRREGARYTVTYCENMCKYIGSRVGPVLPNEWALWDVFNDCQYEVGMWLDHPGYPMPEAYAEVLNGQRYTA